MPVLSKPSGAAVLQPLNAEFCGIFRTFWSYFSQVSERSDLMCMLKAARQVSARFALGGACLETQTSYKLVVSNGVALTQQTGVQLSPHPYSEEEPQNCRLCNIPLSEHTDNIDAGSSSKIPQKQEPKYLPVITSVIPPASSYKLKPSGPHLLCLP